MKNREKFAKEILDIACNGGVIAVTKDNKVVCCRDINCEQCLFHKTNYYESYCDYEATMRWAESEYVEKNLQLHQEKKTSLMPFSFYLIVILQEMKIIHFMFIMTSQYVVINCGYLIMHVMICQKICMVVCLTLSNGKMKNLGMWKT
nr:MAG: hypothetical protein [Bacteriophage sp.]